MEGAKPGEYRVMATRARACFQKEKVGNNIRSSQEAVLGVRWILPRGSTADDFSESGGG